MNKHFFIRLGTILFIILFLIGCQEDTDQQETTEERIVPVQTAKVEHGELMIEKQFNGRLSPEKVIPVMPRNPGELDEILLENGDVVDEDDIIAKIKTPVGTQNIRAPEAGEIIELDQEKGDMLSGEEPLALIIQLDKLILDFTVTESDRSLFKKNDTLKVMIAGKKYDYSIEQVDKLPDDTGLYPVSGKVKNKKDRLIPGMIATINVPERRIKDTILIKTASLIEEDDNAFVYVIEDNQAKQIDVTVLEAQSDITAVEGDLSEGDIIVINGQLTLYDGAKVEIVGEENES